MKSQTLFDDMMVRWPETIRIDDASGVADGGGVFPTLSHARDEVESGVSDANEWRKLAVWAFFQAAHKLAINAYHRNSSSISLKEISISEFERFMLMNLSDESWDSERELFELSHR